MLTIRLGRIGSRNKPAFRIIVCEKGRDNYGNILENLGAYNPRSKELKVDAEKVNAYISKGAQLSPTLNNLFIDKGIIKEAKKMKTRRVNTERLIKKRADAEKAKADAKAAEEAAKAAAKAAEEAAKVAAEEAAKAAEEAAPAVEEPAPAEPAAA